MKGSSCLISVVFIIHRDFALNEERLTSDIPWGFDTLHNGFAACRLAISCNEQRERRSDKDENDGDELHIVDDRVCVIRLELSRYFGCRTGAPFISRRSV